MVPSGLGDVYKRQALRCYGSKHFMLYDELDHIIIDQALLVLKCIHKSFFTDPVDHTWDPGRCFMDLIQRFGCKDLLGTSGVIHMACDILFCLRSVQVWQGTVHINALADCGIPLQFQLVFPQFGLTDQYNSHRTHGIKSVVEQKTEFFQCFLFKQMSFIKDADDLFVLHSPDDLDLLLQLAFGITTVKPGFQSQLSSSPL